MPRDKYGLTPKQARFAEEYLVDCNATQAAIRAGYSARTARSQGQRLLTNVDVAAAIVEVQAARRNRLEVTVDSISAELDESRKLAFKLGQAGAAVSATTAKAKLHGLLTGKPKAVAAPGNVTFRMCWAGDKDSFDKQSTEINGSEAGVAEITGDHRHPGAAIEPRRAPKSPPFCVLGEQ